MRRGKFKVRSRNSMGILVLIVFLALIPIIICLTELREQHFIFQMICESIKEKPTGAGDVLEYPYWTLYCQQFQLQSVCGLG